jgi:hypothetical protein
VLLANWGPASLKELSDGRNSIVHEQKLPLTHIDQLLLPTIVMEKFLTNIASIIAEKLSVPLTILGREYAPPGGQV